MRTVLAAGVVMLASCKHCDEAGSSAPPVDAAAHPSAVLTVDASAAASDSAAPLDASPAPVPEYDAGPSACRLLYGPAEQPFRGPAAMWMTPGELRLVANDAGRPRVFAVPFGPAGSPKAGPVVPPRPASFVGMRWPPCELAGGFVYCQGPGGALTRTTLGRDDTKTLAAKSRSGTRIGAAPLGAGHSVVVFLDLRHTTEGDMLQAFAVLDEQSEPVRVSEDGAGATTFRVASRGEGAVVVYLDARSAMVPIHARPMAFRGDETLALGEDAVVFVGGAPERGVDLTAASSDGSLFALVPMGRDARDFGMAAIPIHDPPKEDVPAVWSAYPNGLDPAPAAATVAASGEAWVARVRPREAMPGARRVLELGRLDRGGIFRSLGVIADGKPITDVAVAVDAHGTAWILYGDTKATWLERRACP